MSNQTNQFSSSSRLLSAADFNRVFSNPIRTADRYFTILASPNEFNKARLGLAISKKNARRAVDRNRIKRITRESFRINQHSLDGLDLVVMTKPLSVKVLNEKLFTSLKNHWKILSNKASTNLG